MQELKIVYDDTQGIYLVSDDDADVLYTIPSVPPCPIDDGADEWNRKYVVPSGIVESTAEHIFIVRGKMRAIVLYDDRDVLIEDTSDLAVVRIENGRDVIAADCPDIEIEPALELRRMGDDWYAITQSWAMKMDPEMFASCYLDAEHNQYDLFGTAIIAGVIYPEQSKYDTIYVAGSRFIIISEDIRASNELFKY